MDKLDIFEQYGSNYVTVAYFQHYQTAGADVEAALKDRIFPFLTPSPAPPMEGGRGFFFDVFLSKFFKYVKFFKIGSQLFYL